MQKNNILLYHSFLLDEMIAKNKFLQDNPDLISKVEKIIEGNCFSVHWFLVATTNSSFSPLTVYNQINCLKF